MKRLGFSGLIFFGILAHSLTAFQNGPPGPDPSPTYLVHLSDPSVVKRVIDRVGDLPPREMPWLLNSAEARRHQRRLEATQIRLLTSAPVEDDPAPEPAGLGRRVQVLSRHTRLLNLIVLRADPKTLQRLSRDPRVRGIYPNRPRYPLLDAAPAVVNAPGAWDAVGGVRQAGLGIRIAIIDSGIRQDHPMFSGAGLLAPAGFPLGDSSFTNNKVIVARSYVDPIYGLRKQDNQTPEDELGHGSQVAGIAAGRQVMTPQGLIQGIAPMAFLGNYKIFGNPSINPSTTAAALIAALEDAVADGMDVINLSLGGVAAEPALDPEQEAIALAREAGVVVVAAAGNAGPQTRSITSPGTSPAAVTVGSTSNARIFATFLEIGADRPLPSSLQRIAYVAGSGPLIAEAVGPLPLQPVAPLDATELACDPLPAESLNGTAVLVKRGDCLFATKARRAFDAGAAALLVYNHLEGSPVVMAGLQAFDRPAVMIGKENGEDLRDLLLEGVQLQLVIRPETEDSAVPSQPDVLADSSSRGPAIGLGLKPDLSAPGQDMHTASNRLTPEPQYSRNVNGTSFSAPLVSGGAALLKQHRRDWAEGLSAGQFARAIQSLLVNTAAKSVTWQNQPARAIHTGNGRLNLAEAVEATAVLDPVSISFGLQEDPPESQLRRAVELRNLNPAAQTFDVQLVPRFENPSVALSVAPAVLTLAAGEIGRIEISAEFQPPLRPGTFEGHLQIDGSRGTRLTATYWGALSLPDPSTILTIRQSGPADYRDIESALKVARPGNVIEVRDSAVYPARLQIGANEEGLLQNELTLRSAAGETATIDAARLGMEPALKVAGVKGVTVEGFRIQSAHTGILYQNASGIVRHNRIEDSADGPLVAGIELIDSRVHLYRNTLRLGGTGIRVLSSSTLLQDNYVGPSTAGQSHREGISASSGSRLGIFENRIEDRPEAGAALRLFGSSALVKGGRLRSAGKDGIRAQGVPAELTVLDTRIEDHPQYGVFLGRGARATLGRTEIRNSGAAGLFMEETAGASVRSSRLHGNGAGIQTVASELHLFSSLISASTAGDGIFASGGTLDLRQSTVVGNSGFGVSDSGSQISITDSILVRNRSGDLFGPTASQVSGTLIGDGQFQGIQGNFSADPMFSDSEAFDFSLRPGSPAIDRGGDLAPFQSLDFLSHDRVTDGDEDGEPRSDLGALESASDFGPPRILPVTTPAAGKFTGLALINAAPEPGRVRLQAHHPAGRLLETVEAQIPAGAQLSLLLPEIFQTSGIGWVEILASRPEVTALTLLGNDPLDFLDGADLGIPRSGKLFFPEIRASDREATRLLLVNPHARELEVRLAWIRPPAAEVVRIHAVPARGRLELDFSHTFDTPTGGGYVTAEASRGEAIGGLLILERAQSRAMVRPLGPAQAAPLLFAAQLASSPDGIETHVNVLNAGEDAASLTLEALREDGTPIASTTIENLPAGGQLNRRARELFEFPPQLVLGWLRIQSEGGALLGTVAFGHPSGRFLAVQALQSRGAREFMLGQAVHTAEFFSGLALLNPSGESVLATVQLFHPGGELAGIGFLELDPGTRTARLLPELIPDLAPPQIGYLRVRATAPLIGFQILGSHSLAFLSAVPPQTLVE